MSNRRVRELEKDIELLQNRDRILTDTIRSLEKIIDEQEDDHIAMGNKFADEKMELQRELSNECSKVAILTADLESLKTRLDGLGSEARQTRLLVVLQEDLERAMNMMLRFAAALGIQRSGPGTLYAEIQEFANKYGMYYRAPDSAHDVVRNLFPDAPEAIGPPKETPQLTSGEDK
jgi:chromosome segregation ATPase